jgi:hypothetical protein
MKEIKEVKVYICPETGKKCRSRAEAERSAAAAIKAKEDAVIAAEQKKLAEKSNLEKKDWIRLNATNVSEIENLIVEKAKEFWGFDCEVDINVTFGQVSNSHGAPMSKKTNWSGDDKNYPTSFLGWSGHVRASIKNYKKTKNSSESVGSLLFGSYYAGTGGPGFRGFHTSSGCPGDAGGQYPMDIGFYFFLEDFPKLAECYELFKIEYQKIINHKGNLQSQDEAANRYANGCQDVLDLEAQAYELMKKANILKSQHSQKYILDNPVQAPTIDPQLDAIKENFRTYFGYGEFRNYYGNED